MMKQTQQCLLPLFFMPLIKEISINLCMKESYVLIFSSDIVYSLRCDVVDVKFFYQNLYKM